MYQGIVSNTGSDAGDIQQQQVSYLGKVSTYTVINPYGLIGKPPLGSAVWISPVLGDEANKAGIANAITTRTKNLKDGETGLLNHLTGTRVFLNAEGQLVIDTSAETIITSTNDVTITAPETIINGDLLVNGDLNVNGDISTSGDLTVDGNISVGLAVTVVGNVTAATFIIA